MKAQQGTASAYPEEFVPADPGKPGDAEKDDACEQHPVPYDIDLIQRDKTSEEAGKTGKQNT